MEWSELDYENFDKPVGIRLSCEDNRLVPSLEVRGRIERSVDEDKIDLLYNSIEEDYQDRRIVFDASEVGNLESLKSDIRQIVDDFNYRPTPEELYEKEKRLEKEGIVGRNYEFTKERAESIVENMKEQDYEDVLLEIVKLY